MKIYEGMFLVDAKEARKASASMEDHIRGLVAKCGGEIKVFEKWDERKLAYEIKGTRNGTYYLTYFTGLDDTVSRLYRECELSPILLRALFLRVKKVPEPRREEPEEAPAAEEQGGGPAVETDREGAAQGPSMEKGESDTETAAESGGGKEDGDAGADEKAVEEKVEGEG